MSIWKVAPITQEPDIELTQWQIMELPNGDRHFVGYNARGWEGRVSSKVVTFDNDSVIGITESNRNYKLAGKPGFNRDASYVWNQWRRINGVEEFEDISEQFKK